MGGNGCVNFHSGFLLTIFRDPIQGLPVITTREALATTWSVSNGNGHFAAGPPYLDLQWAIIWRATSST
ncbi:hypothetical protein AXYL_06890 (plasmid) [Achromobacter xylosoxidans A8]|uniref:Uncharacterized protein n=1 Tax=Achromobacter xylosoxidans (strain A8) TaxID=762376 RepID=E3HYL8_ACHXA|nr:hypothetical protein AXYL_06890 [Achromobacter xylosoxidans A8]